MQSLIWHYFPWNIQVSITNFSLFSTHMARFSNYIFHSAWKDVLLYIYMLELYWTPQSQLEEAVFLDPLIFKLTYTDMSANKHFHMNITKHGLLIPTSTQPWPSLVFVVREDQISLP